MSDHRSPRATLLATALLAAACGNAAREAASPAAPAPSASTPAPEASASGSAVARPDLTARSLPPTLRKTPFIGLTVSGGVSLGSYEAGFLYYLTEVAKLPGNRSAVDLKLVTGASAGNINALLSILSLCNRHQSNPQDSLFWRTWIRVGSRELFKPPDAGDPPDRGHGAFSRGALLRIAGDLESAWFRGVEEGCDKVLAVSTTRLKSAEVALQDGFKVPRQEEKFVVRIRYQGPGKAPLVTNFVDPTDALPRPMLPFPVDQSQRDDQLKAFSLLLDLLLASAAFPVAFPPQSLPHCMTPGTRRLDAAASQQPSPQAAPQRREKGTECGDYPIFTEDFIDGGVFDNTPLRLADHLTGYLDPGGNWRTPGTPPPPNAAKPQGGFLFIDPDTAAYPSPSESSASPALPLIPQIGSFLSSFIATARSKELYTLIQERPDIDVVLSRRNFPTASGHLANFFGFFEESFRRFDFYLGMYDAHRMAMRTLPSVLDVSRPPDVTAVWDPFVCMASVFGDEPADGKKRDQSTCHVDEARCASLDPTQCSRKRRHAAAFRALLQVAVARLYSHCEGLPPAITPTIDHHHCLRAALHKPMPEVDGVPQGERGFFRRRRHENDFEHTLRLLDRYNFRFDDLLGVGAIGGSDEAMTRMRYQLASLLERTAAKQPGGDASVLRLLGKPALNFVYYAPPPTIVHISIGRGNEVGFSRLLGWNNTRFTLGVQAKGLEELAFSEQGEAAFTPLIGAEAELYGSAVYQVRLGLRGGYQFSTKGIRASDCRNPEATNSFSASRSDCSSFVAQLPLSVAIFERIRFQLSPEYLAPHSPLDGKSWNILFGVGGQMISPFF